MKKFLCILLTVLTVILMASCVSTVTDIESIDHGNEHIGDTIGTKEITSSTNSDNEDIDVTKEVENVTDETPASSDKDEKTTSDEVTIEEKLCFEYKGITVTAKKIVYDSWEGTGLRLNIANDTNKTYTVAVENVIVNDCMMVDYFSCEVAAGKKANDTIYFSSAALDEAGIEQIGKIEIYFYIYDPETYDRVYESECVTITTSAYDNMNTARKNDGHILYEGNDIKIVGQYVEQYNWLGKSIVLYIENNRNENVNISCEEMSINGYMVSGWMYETIYAGKYIITEISISDSDLEDNDIDKIEEFELKFEVKHPDTYKVIFKTDALSFIVG